MATTTLQTKKIPLLPETTTGSTTDLLVLERISTGITSKITSVNLFTSALGATNYSVPNPSAGGHIVNKQYMEGAFKTLILQTIYGIGSLYFTTAAGNPSVLMGFGTWVAFGAGRTIVGVDGSADFANVGDIGGAKTHTLSVAELPAHTHVIDPPATNTTSNGDHTHTVSAGGTISNVIEQRYADVGGNINSTGSQTTSTSGAHTHSVDIPSFNSGSVGSGAAHNNLQPYIVIYMWKRTA